MEVVHNPDQHRFEVALPEGKLAELSYALNPGTLSITHTYVPRAFEGQGIASRMTREALRYAEAAGLEVIPLCSFAVAYLARQQRRSGRAL